MIKIDTGIIVESASELPSIPFGCDLFLDFETNNIISRKVPISPYGTDRICGAAVTFNDNPLAWYIPVRHTMGTNVNLGAFQDWLADTLGRAKRWINHNVKFDAHFAVQDGALFECELVDTLVLAKIIDADRGFGRAGYALDELALDWLERDITGHGHKLKAYLDCMKKIDKSYANIPIDILGDYAMTDVLTNRDLWKCLQRRRHDQTAYVWDMEIKLTPVLFDIEREGIRVDVDQLNTESLKYRIDLLDMEREIQALTGSTIRPDKNDDCYDYFCNHLQLPVVSWTVDDDNKSGSPSFDKDALQVYKTLPTVTSHVRDVIDRMLEYRKRATQLKLFIEPYLALNVDGRLHPTYTQSVRSGRMACKAPNDQQLDDFAKTLRLPDDETCGFLSMDYSQIEFRVIVHYLNAIDAIKAYERDPDTDFHRWVADMCQIDRDPAKNVNFAMGFGGGKRRIVSMLAGNPKLVSSLIAEVEARVLRGELDSSKKIGEVARVCTSRGEDVYRKYHEALPQLQPSSKKAEGSARMRGYVYTWYGRHLHMNHRIAHRAFNRVVQGTAAEIIKERVVALAPRYNKTVRDAGISVRALVHDDTLFHGPREALDDPKMQDTLATTMENISKPMRVPMRVAAKRSDVHWPNEDTPKIKLARSFSTF